MANLIERKPFNSHPNWSPVRCLRSQWWGTSRRPLFGWSSRWGRDQGVRTSPGTLRRQIIHQTELEAILKHLAFLLTLPNGSFGDPSRGKNLASPWGRWYKWIESLSWDPRDTCLWFPALGFRTVSTFQIQLPSVAAPGRRHLLMGPGEKTQFTGWLTQVKDSPNPCPLSRWCHQTISSSVVPFSSCPQSFPASGSFPMGQLFASGGQRIGVSASTSVLPMNTQDWSPLVVCLAVQGTLKSLLQHHSSKASILQCSAFFIVQLSHPYMTTGKTTTLSR